MVLTSFKRKEGEDFSLLYVFEDIGDNDVGAKREDIQKLETFSKAFFFSFANSNGIRRTREDLWSNPLCTFYCQGVFFYFFFVRLCVFLISNTWEIIYLSHASFVMSFYDLSLRK